MLRIADVDANQTLFIQEEIEKMVKLWPDERTFQEEITEKKHWQASGFPGAFVFTSMTFFGSAKPILTQTKHPQPWFTTNTMTWWGGGDMCGDNI